VIAVSAGEHGPGDARQFVGNGHRHYVAWSPGLLIRRRTISLIAFGHYLNGPELVLIEMSGCSPIVTADSPTRLDLKNADLVPRKV
jgi:hypothetical protein